MSYIVVLNRRKKRILLPIDKIKSIEEIEIAGPPITTNVQITVPDGYVICDPAIKIEEIIEILRRSSYVYETEAVEAIGEL